MHLLYRFNTGGLENGVVNLINQLPASKFRHAVVALDEVVPDFARRITRTDVEFVSLHKPPGQTAWLYPRLHRLFRAMRPAVLHTRNLAALECQAPAWLAGVPVRLHGEHGWDVGDLDGSNRVYQWNRRIFRPFVQHWVALSRAQQAYLTGPIGVSPGLVTQICNGVDSVRFSRAGAARDVIPGCPFNDPGLFLVGTVGRMQTVKNQTALAEAFVQLLQQRPEMRGCLRLVMVGDGPLRAQAQRRLDEAGVGALAWLPGERSDVADVMRGLDCFVLPSLAEGISNTILEAMSSGLPVVATRVGGNADLVDHGRTGLLVRAGDVDAMTRGLQQLTSDPSAASVMGRAGRERVEREFSLQAMVSAYQGLYEQLLAARIGRQAQTTSGVD